MFVQQIPALKFTWRVKLITLILINPSFLISENVHTYLHFKLQIKLKHVFIVKGNDHVPWHFDHFVKSDAIMVKSPSDEGTKKGRHEKSVYHQQYIKEQYQRACFFLTWEKLHYLLFAATKRKPSKPNKSVSCCFWTIWTSVLHNPVHLDIVGFKNYNDRITVKWYSLRQVKNNINDNFIYNWQHTPSTYRWPIVSLSFFTAIFRSSSVSNSTNASPLGRPSLVYVKWMPPPLLMILQSTFQMVYSYTSEYLYLLQDFYPVITFCSYIPEKNLCTSSTEQDQGRPLMRTTYPSSAMTGFGPWKENKSISRISFSIKNNRKQGATVLIPVCSV